MFDKLRRALRGTRGDTDPMLVVASIAVGLVVTATLASVIVELVSWSGVQATNSNYSSQMKIAQQAFHAELQDAQEVVVLSPTQVAVIEGQGSPITKPASGKYRWFEWTVSKTSGSVVVERTGTSGGATLATQPTTWQNAITLTQATSATIAITNHAGRTISYGSDGTPKAAAAKPSADSAVPQTEWASSVPRRITIDVTSAVVHPHLGGHGKAATDRHDQLDGVDVLADESYVLSGSTINPSSSEPQYAPVATPSATRSGAVGKTSKVVLAATDPSSAPCGPLSMQSAAISWSQAWPTAGSASGNASKNDTYSASGVTKTVTLPGGARETLTEKLSCWPASAGGNQQPGSIPSNSKITRSGVDAASSATQFVVPLATPAPGITSITPSSVRVTWSSVTSVPATYSAACHFDGTGGPVFGSTSTSGTSATFAIADGNEGRGVVCSVTASTAAPEASGAGWTSTGASSATVPWPPTSWAPSISPKPSSGQNPITQVLTATPTSSCPTRTSAILSVAGTVAGGPSVGSATVTIFEAYSTAYAETPGLACQTPWSTSSTVYGASAMWTTHAAPPPLPGAPTGVSSQVNWYHLADGGNGFEGVLAFDPGDTNTTSFEIQYDYTNALGRPSGWLSAGTAAASDGSFVIIDNSAPVGGGSPEARIRAVGPGGTSGWITVPGVWAAGHL